VGILTLDECHRWARQRFEETRASIVPFNLVWAYFLLRGVRWLWMLTLAACVLSLVFEIAAGSIHWRGFALSAVGLVLLSLPETWRYFAAAKSAVAV
jgi:hypothetical protein